MNLYRGTIITFMGNILTGAISLLLSVFLARTLGPVGKGVIAYFIVFSSLIAMVADLGVSISNVYFLRSWNSNRTILFTNSLIWSILAGCLSGIVGYIIYISFHGEFNSYILLYTFGCVPMYLFVNVESNLLLAYGKVYAYTMGNLLQLLLALVYTLLLFFLAGISLSNCMLAQLLALFTVSIYIFIELDISSLRYDIALLMKSIKYAFVGHVGTVVQFCNYRLDVLILGYLSGNRSVGIYSVAYTLAEILWRFPRALGAMLYPSITGISAEAANDITLNVFKISNVIMFISTGILAYVGGLIITFLYGKQFSMAIVPFLVLLPGVLLFSWSSLLVEDLKGRGHPHVKAWTAGAGLVVTVILDILLIPKYREMGAAIASSVAYSISGIVSLMFFSRLTGNPIYKILLISPNDISRFAGWVISKYRRYKAFRLSDI